MLRSAPFFPTTVEDYRKIVDDYDTWLFDCDGVIWRGGTPIEGAADVLRFLRSKGKRIIFVTNNPTHSRAAFKKRFAAMGVEASVDEIFSSAYASAVYISSVMKLPKDKKVYVVGMQGIEEELREQGIAVCGGTDPSDNTLESVDEPAVDPSVGAVLFSWDGSINYTKLSKAFQYLTRNPKCAFLCSDEDLTYPVEDGVLFLGTGALTATIRYALGRDPVCFGKPSKTMFECIEAKHKINPATTIMVGDRLDSDMAFGKNGGVATMLVLSGLACLADISDTSPVISDFVTGALTDFGVLRSP
ncbi:2-phosphoglycolate phosphatase [Dendrothele bispora CBS 962.96]|uniref:4-nitrophenylphosphatase n=1 Tax=Dendrothele bispora (strain CBS 962.96) TaxID=1314807 RepID=A0A4V4HE60_DENBC|nr:2-phosphoglycolate phosphatase [Dendrothele bispora CBS 962.96]